VYIWIYIFADLYIYTFKCAHICIALFRNECGGMSLHQLWVFTFIWIDIDIRVYIYVYICIYTNVYIYICVYFSVYIYLHIHMCVYVYAYLCMLRYTYVCGGGYSYPPYIYEYIDSGSFYLYIARTYIQMHVKRASIHMYMCDGFGTFDHISQIHIHLCIYNRVISRYVHVRILMYFYMYAGEGVYVNCGSFYSYIAHVHVSITDLFI